MKIITCQFRCLLEVVCILYALTSVLNLLLFRGEKTESTKSTSSLYSNFWLVSAGTLKRRIGRVEPRRVYCMPKAFPRSQLGRFSVAIILPLTFVLAVIFSSAGAMTELKETEMSEITGQALMQMGKTQGEAGSDLTFYKAGLDAELELNMNIDKLQLGCGGINGAGCDIDIDNLSLSGQTFPDGRPASGALLTRPFFEFAIKNDSSKTLREVVGIRMSAEKATGLLTAGTENSATPNGINTLSGYMEIAATSGTAQVAQTRFGRNDSCAGGNCVDVNNNGDFLSVTCPSGTNCNAIDISEVLTGIADVSAPLCTSGCGYNAFYSRPNLSSGVTLSPSGSPLSVGFNIAPFTLSGNRMTSAQVDAVAALPNIPLHAEDANGDGFSDGTLNVRLARQVCAAYCIVSVQDVPNLHLRGQISGLNANISFQEDLGFIHKIPVNNPFSLSMQKTALRWPGAAEVAETGWWMSFQDPVDLGVLNPSQQVDISPVFPQVSGLLSSYFEANPIAVSNSDSWDVLLSGHMYKDVGTINLGGASVDMNLQDLQLSTQNFQPNCWGSAKFC